MERFIGLPASTGIAIGPCWVYEPIQVDVERIEVFDSGSEIQRLESAVIESGNQLEALQKKASETIGVEEAAIFEAHGLFLSDPEFIGGIKALITDQQVNAAYAVDITANKFAEQMLALEDEYFSQRAQDIQDVSRRLIYCLAGVDLSELEFPQQPVIVIAEDLTPSDTMQFDRNRILGLCTLKGGPTSHTAILARSLGVPAAVSVAFDPSSIVNGTVAILDGSTGELIVQPDTEVKLAFIESQTEWAANWEQQLSEAKLPAVTTDGYQVEVVANIGNAADAKQAIEHGAEGVGLLRTEFMYLDRKSLPKEEEQVSAYREIFEVMAGLPIVVRTLDIGGDKEVDYLGLKQEPNPFLGWRAIRMVSESPGVLLDQFKALLQAGVGFDLRIMIPLVSSLEEVILARELLRDAIQSLKSEKAAFTKEFQFGIMVEVPSAALLVEDIAPYVDFFSIGTNDLTQYTLAVDRTNERVAALASPFHPAVMRLIAMTIENAHKHGKWVGLCGEMAGDPAAAPVLLGLGLDEFSMAPASIPGLKALLRSLSRSECQKIAKQALGRSSKQEVLDYLEGIRI
jgi:phosphoenolpyruvate-protein phosphotransferase